MAILEVKQLSKQFNSHSVIQNVSFSVPDGCIFGFLGQNGAGKTTMLNLILGLLKPSDGEIYVCGERVNYGETKTNRLIGYLPDVPEFYPYMNAREYLKLCGEVTGMSKDQIKSKSEELLHLVGLYNVNQKIGRFSRGMKQRLGIAAALLNEPKLLICDEPTSALDPIGRKEILDILLAVKEKTTVIFSTHILSDVERICDQVAILHQGQLVLNGSLHEMKQYRKQNLISLEFQKIEDKVRMLEALQSLDFITKLEVEENKLMMSVDNLRDGGRKVLEIALQLNISLQKYEVLEPTLESLFMEVVR
ncbi:MAG: ABC transporter ATP-binding protein [Turicibacter sp.]|nr:ABC transporter ATP-binding protein [Turicibacter sp.]